MTLLSRLGIAIKQKLDLKLDISQYTANDVLAKLKTVDGISSGLDADLVRGMDITNISNGNTVVMRDSNGDFSARIVTASLSGNSSTATKLETSRTIAISGGATGTATQFNGSANISINVTGLNASNLNMGTIPNGRISGSYTNLTNIVGTGYLDFTKYLAKEGTALNPSFSFLNNSNTGIYQSALDSLSISIAGIDKVLINSDGITATLLGNASTATKLFTARKINNVSFDGTADINITDDSKLPLSGGTLTGNLVGTVFTGTSFNSITGLSNILPVVASNATIGISALVARADHIHPAQTTISGNAGSATKLSTARKINDVDFDGTIDITVYDNTKLPLSGGTLTGALIGTSFNSITGLSISAPVVAGVATVGTSTLTARADHIHPAQTTVSGNAGTATILATGRTISITGDITYTSPAFNGSTNITAVATLANSGVVAGIYNNSNVGVRPFTVDSKGRITSIGTEVAITPSWSNITNTPTTVAGYNISDVYTTSNTFSKSEINALIQGLKGKASATVATTEALTFNTAQTMIDNVTLVATDRVLIKNQLDATQNGIYTNVTTNSWTRAENADTAEELLSAYVFIDTGDANKDTSWLQTSDNIILGTTALNWVKFSGSGAYAPVVHTHSANDIVSGVLPVSRGGSGVSTITGMIKGNGTGAFSTATAGVDYVIPSGSITGNAATATKLATIVTINNVNFDGSGNIVITDNTKQPLDSDLSAIAALTGTSGLLRKTAANTWSLDTNTYVTSSGVTSVGATLPITSTGGNAPTIAINAATITTAGSMSAADKSKLDNIAANANNFTLPIATSTVLGGVELISDVVQSVAANAVSTTAGRTYGIQLNNSGQAVVNIPWVDTNTTYSNATTSVAGLMSATDKTKLDGVASNANNYVLPVATNTILGGVKAGSNITIDANGVISASAAVTSLAWSNVTSTPTTLAGYGITDAASASHIHSAADITTGVLVVARGGTGVTTSTGSGNLVLSNSATLTTPTISGVLTTTAPTASTALTGLTSAPIVVPEVALSAAGFAPMIHGKTLVTGGYRKHISIGAYRESMIGYDGGIYLAQGGNDSNPTEYFLLKQGGDIIHSGGKVYLNSTNVSTYAMPKEGGDFTGQITVVTTGNTYATSGLVTKGNGATNTVFPSIGFNQNTLYSGSMVLKADGDFKLYKADGTTLANLTAGIFTGNLTGNVTGNVSGSSGSCTGNAATATKLSTARTIAITGDITYTSGSFDGSANITGVATLANTGVTAGTYKSVTVNAKGLVTAGTNPTTLTGYGISDAYTKTESNSAFVSLAGSYSEPSWITGLNYSKLTGTVPTWNQNTTGNANGANVLLTARLINGYSFNGSADIGTDYRTQDFCNQASQILTGGGTISVSATWEVKWSSRFITISSGRGAKSAALGYFDIDMPAVATVITGVGGATNKTVTANGIPLAAWESLYYILPIGLTGTGIPANFRVVGYTADVDVPSTWIKICTFNSDGAYVDFTNSVSLRANTSINTNLYDVLGSDISGAVPSATVLATARTINGTSFNGSANITTANWGTSRILSFTGDATGSASVNGSANVATTMTVSAINNITFRNGNGTNATTSEAIAANGIGYVNGMGIFGQNDGALYSQAHSNNWVHQIFGDYRTGQLAVRGKKEGVWQGWRTLLDSGNISSINIEDLTTLNRSFTVRIATKSNIALSGLQTIDGVTLVTGNLVLVKNQTTASQNGIYEVVAGAWSRTASANFSAGIAGAVVKVSEGIINGGQIFTTTFRSFNVLNTDAMVWKPRDLIYLMGVKSITDFMEFDADGNALGTTAQQLGKLQTALYNSYTLNIGRYNIIINGQLIVPNGVNIISDTNPSFNSSSYAQLRVTTSGRIIPSGSNNFENFQVRAFNESTSQFLGAEQMTGIGFSTKAAGHPIGDIIFKGLAIGGFARGIDLLEGGDGGNNTRGKIWIENCKFDNMIDVHLGHCYDTIYITNCHAWPFIGRSDNTSSAVVPGNSAKWVPRTAMIYCSNAYVDWLQVTNCFSHSKRSFILGYFSGTVSGGGYDYEDYTLTNTHPAYASNVGIDIIIDADAGRGKTSISNVTFNGGEVHIRAAFNNASTNIKRQINQVRVTGSTHTGASNCYIYARDVSTSDGNPGGYISVSNMVTGNNDLAIARHLVYADGYCKVKVDGYTRTQVSVSEAYNSGGAAVIKLNGGMSPDGTSADSNINADLLDGMQPTVDGAANSIARRGADGGLGGTYIGAFTSIDARIEAFGGASRWKYLRLSTNGAVNWDIATHDGEDTASLRFRTVDGVDRFKIYQSGEVAVTNTMRFYKNTPAVNGSSYSQGAIELRTDDGSNPILGFHRGRYSATALYENGGQLYTRNNSNVEGIVYTSANLGISESNLANTVVRRNGSGNFATQDIVMFGHLFTNVIRSNAGTAKEILWTDDNFLSIGYGTNYNRMYKNLYFNNDATDSPELIFSGGANGEWEMDTAGGQFRLFKGWSPRFMIDGNGLAYLSANYGTDGGLTTTNASNLYISSTGAILRSTSSRKYKTDIQDIDNSYVETFFNNARPVFYRPTEPNDNSVWGYWGFIAEEIAEFDKRLVHWRYENEKVRVTKTKLDHPEEPEVSHYEYYTDGEDKYYYDDFGEPLEYKVIDIPFKAATYKEYEVEETIEDKEKAMVAEGVQYERITVLLTAKVQSQQKEIDSLKNDVEELKILVNQLLNK